MRAWPALLLLLPLAAAAQSTGPDENYRGPERQDEARVPLPQYPKPENFLPFEVTATTPFAFFVDAESISVAADRVVRYTLIAKSADGALNVSYEGMRCTDRKFRIYAFGSVGNSWFDTRNSRWNTIPTDLRNAQRGVLFDEYFCPLTGYVASAEDAVRALKYGGNSRSERQRF